MPSRARPDWPYSSQLDQWQTGSEITSGYRASFPRRSADGRLRTLRCTRSRGLRRTAAVIAACLVVAAVSAELVDLSRSRSGGTSELLPQDRPGIPVTGRTQLAGCGDVELDLTEQPAVTYVGEPVSVKLHAAPANTCTIRVELQVSGIAEAQIAPDRIVALTLLSGAQREASWTVVPLSAGPAVISLTILAGKSDDVATHLTKRIEVAASRRLVEGARSLESLLANAVVEATASDGRALRVGHQGTLTLAVTLEPMLPLADGLDSLAVMELCVQASDAGMSGRNCWESTVNVTELVHFERHIAVRAEQSGPLSVIAAIKLRGQVDDKPAFAERSFAQPAGESVVSAAGRLGAVEQAVLRWLGVAAAIGLVAGFFRRRVVRLRSRRRLLPRGKSRSGDAPLT